MRSRPYAGAALRRLAPAWYDQAQRLGTCPSRKDWPPIYQRNAAPFRSRPQTAGLKKGACPRWVRQVGTLIYVISIFVILGSFCHEPIICLWHVAKTVFAIPVAKAS